MVRHRMKDKVFLILMVTTLFCVLFMNDDEKIVLNRGMELIHTEEDPCGLTNTNPDETSLLKLAKQMANLSSPQGSASWKKNKFALSQTDKFFVKSPKPIFSHTTQNVIDLLQGYGLTRVDFASSDEDNQKPVASKEESVVIVEYSYFIQEHQNDRKTGINCVGDDPACLNKPRIIIQAEQIPGHLWLKPYLVKCHESPTCLIWDFSDSNLEWYKANNLADSVLLIPLMFHDRYKKHFPVTIEPIRSRSNDVTLFGTITERRRRFWRDKLSNYGNKWNIRYEMKYRIPEIVKTYADSKICLVVHSYDSGGGEYHRLSELNQMGCIPVMETFTDKIGMDLLSQCGGVIFADYDGLIPAIEQILSSNDFEDLQDKINDAISWWQLNFPIKWTNFLTSILGPRDTISDITTTIH